MNRVANLSPDKRRDLFRETSAQLAINPAIIEKDFWVCWVLKQLFADPVFHNRLVFKGGTSLSKVYNQIKRFSEDVDLILDWRLLGFGSGQQDPFQDFNSATQRDRFNKQLNNQAATYINDKFVPELARVFAPCSQVSSVVDSIDPQAVNVTYPAAFSENYLRPEIRLEIGPLASWIPSSLKTIQPFSAQAFPDVFDEPECPVVAIEAERTFWEKATILHQQAHRTNAMPPRYSRHYYDMYKLANGSVKETAFSDLKLLNDVIAFKQRFYPSAWAKYEEAQPGTFKLTPTEKRLTELRKDYREMGFMIFGEIPTFDRIMDTLHELEAEINGLIQ